MYREFWQLYVREHRGLGKLVLIGLFTVASSFLEAINVGLLVPLLESLQSSDQAGGHWISRGVAKVFGGLGIPYELWTIILALGVLVGVVSILRYLRTVMVAKAALGFAVWLRSRTMWNFLNADISYFHKEKIGRVTDTLLGQSNTASVSLEQVGEIVSNVGIITALTVGAFILSPSLTAIAIGVLLVVTLSVQFHVIRAGRIGAIAVQRGQDLTANVVETLSAINVIKPFSLERRQWTEMNQKSGEWAEIGVARQKNRGQMSVIQESGQFALIGGMVFVGGSVLSLDMAIVVTMLFVLYRLAPRLGMVNAARQALGGSLAALHHVKGALDETSDVNIISGDQPIQTFGRSIDLKGVTFSYNEGEPVLKDTSMSIEKGKMTAVAGASGAGKTTLVDLILRNYDPTQGSIRVDGVDLRELDLPSWRSFIGLVSQDVFLFNESVADNISVWRPNVTQEDIVSAAKEAYAHDFIQQLPDGYETVIGDRGWNLSGGQRQRIALARAIIQHPEILILDEATSSLDSESERLFQNYVDEIRGKRTVLVVAHRLSTIHNADKIIVLQDGRIVEEGDWDSLLAQAGIFANYHQLQSNI